MVLTKSIEAAGRSVLVRELTVGEVRDWVAGLDRLPDSAIDLVAALASDEIGLDELRIMSDLTEEDIGRLTASGIADLVATAKVLNPHFFNVRRRLIRAAEPD